MPWRRNHASADGIEINVATAGQQIPISIDQAGLETPLPQSAGSPLQFIDAASLPRSQYAHQAGDRVHILARNEDEVYVIGHQAVSRDTNIELRFGLEQIREETMIVVVLDKYGLSVVATLHGMHRKVGYEHTRMARHVFSF